MHPDEWTLKLNARTILLTIYEWEADKITGCDLKNAFKLIAPNRGKILKAASCDFEYVSSKPRLPFLHVGGPILRCAAIMPPTEAQDSDAAQT